jgi:mono/diheme cytochrome c family protein
MRLFYVCALAGALSATGLALQVRPVTDAVYSSAQAARGQELYKQQCVSCHGDALEGGVGPMLAGQDFVSNWAGRSLAELVDKIANTMPLQAPGSLTRQQATDVAAYMLQVSKLPAGQRDLTPDALSQVAFPAASAAAAPAAGAAAGGGGPALAPTANLAQLMRGITFPNANVIFNVQVKEPVTTRPASPIPFDYVLWGSAQYYGWQAVDQAALALVESTPLFLLPGRRCENGRPVPLDRADYKQWTQDLINVSREVFKVTQARNAEAVAGMAEKLNDTCANCHKRYRDGATEGATRTTDRCQ